MGGGGSGGWSGSRIFSLSEMKSCTSLTYVELMPPAIFYRTFRPLYPATQFLLLLI